MLETVENVYMAFNARYKRVYERRNIEGTGLLGKPQWLCVDSFHWSPKLTTFNSLRLYLVDCIEDVAQKADRLHESEEQDNTEERDLEQEAHSEPKAETGEGKHDGE